MASEIRAQPKIASRKRTQEPQLLGCVRSVEWFLLSTMCAKKAAEREGFFRAHVGRRLLAYAYSSGQEILNTCNLNDYGYRSVHGD